MKGKFIKKLLALSLSAVMVLGTVAPVFATEEAGEEPRADAPTITVGTDDDGKIGKVYVQNNDESYSCVYWGLAKKGTIVEETVVSYDHRWLESSESAGGSNLLDMIRYMELETGEHYLIAFTENDHESRSRVVVLEDYPIMVTVNEIEEAVEYQVGEVTGREYFVGKTTDEYTYADVEGLYENSWLSEEYLEAKNGIFYLDREYLDENYTEWSFEKAEFGKIDATETGCTVVREIYTKVEEGDPYEEVRVDAPTIGLNVDTESIYVINNDEERSSVWYGAATEESIESGKVDLNDGVWLEEGEKDNINDITSVIADDIEDAGKYYFVAYAENDYVFRSELTVLEEYPIIVTETFKEEQLEYQTGEFSGYRYFAEKSEEDYGYAKLSVSVLDEWGDPYTDISKLETRNGIYYWDSEYYDENDVSWTIESAEFGKFDIKENSCTVEQEIYSSAREGEAYEEERSEAPTILLEKDDAGVIQKIKVKNNDAQDGTIFYGIVTREELEQEIMDGDSTWIEGLGTGRILDLEWLVEKYASEDGIYYFVAYMEAGGKAASEWTVLESEPIKVRTTLVEEAALYQTGDNTGNFYFMEHPVADYSSARVTVLVDDSWSDSYSLSKKNGFYYLHASEYDGWVDSWALEQVKFYKKGVEENANLVELFVYSEFEEDGIFVEPKAEAPTMGLHRDDDGNVIGVEITNNLTHDNGELMYGYYWEDNSEVSWCYADAGETVIVSFDELEIPDGVYSKENFVFKCAAYDYDNQIWSQTVTLDYPISMEVQEYSGENIVIYAETDEDGRIWYYMNAEQILGDFSKLYGITEEYSERFKFFKTDDGTQYTADTDSLGLRQMQPSKVVTTDEGMKFVQCKIPKEKITFVERDFSSKEVLILDYDYYNAFIASGGSITVNENSEVELSTDNFTSEEKWTLDYLYQEFVGYDIYVWVQNIAENLKEWANQYWKSEEGSFTAVNYYDTEGNVIAEDSLSEYDVVLIEYAPEIVWVDSMEVTAPEKMKYNETDKVTVTLDAGQDKYPFGREPQIRYESSNPNVLEVDAETGELKAKDVDGVATITVYADEDLRAAEGLTEIVSTSVKITVQGEEEPKPPVTEVFNDIPKGSWYENSVQYVYNEGIIVGDGNVFAPDNGATRAMIAVILYRLAGSPELTEADYEQYNRFKDLPTEKAWYSDAVAWVLKEEVSTGDDYAMCYNPESFVTREQLSLFLWRFAKYAKEDVTVGKTDKELFGETYVNSWAKEGFAWAVDRNIIRGAEETDSEGNLYYVLNPQGGATRAQLARMLHRYIGGATD